MSCAGVHGARALLAAFALLLGKPKASHPPSAPAPARPPVTGPLPMLPSVGRVRVALHGGAVVVTEEVNLPRGTWKGERLDVYVAFGAPGVPSAIDAHLVPVRDGALEADESTAGDPVSLERAPRRPRHAHALLGRDTMAGVVFHLEKDALGRALAPAGLAVLRIRSVLEPAPLDADGARGVVVRLGAAASVPLTLGRISFESPVALAEARLCGGEADPQPLAVWPRSARVATEAPIAPVMAVRHASDDLCLRYWSRPAGK